MAMAFMKLPSSSSSSSSSSGWIGGVPKTGLALDSFITVGPPFTFLAGDCSYIKPFPTVQTRQRVLFAYIPTVHSLESREFDLTSEKHGETSIDRADGQYAEEAETAYYGLQGIEVHATSHRAKVSLNCVMERLSKLEEDLAEMDQEGKSVPNAFSNEEEAHTRARNLQLQLKHLREELLLKDESIKMADSEARQAQNRLMEAEAMLDELRIASVEAEVRQLEHWLHDEKQLSLINGEVLEEFDENLKALEYMEESLSEFEDAVGQMKSALVNRKWMVELLQEEAQISYDTRRLTQGEVDKARWARDNATAELHNLMDELKQRDFETSKAKMEVANAKKELEALSKALKESEKQVEQSHSQKDMLEEEVKARDAILVDFREETKRSMEALKLAAQIKQDLNASRVKVLEISQNLESQVMVAQQMQQDLAENSRAVQAEQALRQMERSIEDLTEEVQILQNESKLRDEAIELMKCEIDNSIAMLSDGAKNREAVRVMELYIKDLERELKDMKISLEDK